MYERQKAVVDSTPALGFLSSSAGTVLCHPGTPDHTKSTRSDTFVISRWMGDSGSVRHEAVTLSGRYIVGIALKTTQISLRRNNRIVFDGKMSGGTLHIAPPSQHLSADFHNRFDLVHLFVQSTYFRECRSDNVDDFTISNSDLLLRDPLSEQLARTLIASVTAQTRSFTESIARTLVMQIVGLGLKKATVNPLPRWRLQKVDEFIEQNLYRTIVLSDLASVAGLSRMHFAAQFRAATGFRPHEYLIRQRVERAKSMLSTTKEPLADVAFSVGFQSQAHFSTVFKRMSGYSPGRWRHLDGCIA